MKAGTRDSHKFSNSDITSVKVTVGGTPNKIYSQGFEEKDTWEEVARYFFGGPNAPEHYESNMNPMVFYTDNHFGLFVDLRSVCGNSLHVSGLRLVNTKGGIKLEIKRKTLGSYNLNCLVFIISNAHLSLLNGQLESIQY